MAGRQFIKGIRGKIVDRVVVVAEDDGIEVEVRFQDNTSFNVRLMVPEPQIVEADILGWRKGNSRVIKKFIG